MPPSYWMAGIYTAEVRLVMVGEGRRRCIQQRRGHNNDDSIAPLVKHRHCIRCYIKYSGSGGPSHGWRRTCYQTCTLLCYINSHAHLGGSYHSDPIIYFPTHFWLWKLLWHPTTLSTPAASTWFHFRASGKWRHIIPCLSAFNSSIHHKSCQLNDRSNQINIDH